MADAATPRKVIATVAVAGFTLFLLYKYLNRKRKTERSVEEQEEISLEMLTEARQMLEERGNLLAIELATLETNDSRAERKRKYLEAEILKVTQEMANVDSLTQRLLEARCRREASQLTRKNETVSDALGRPYRKD